MRPESLPARYTIRHVDVWNSDRKEIDRDVVVQNGRVESILPASAAHEGFTVDGHGLVLMPSGVDAQVHLRAPGQTQKDTPERGLRAALKGGVGALLTMPNTKPVIDSVATLALGRDSVRAAERETGVRVLWSAAMTLGQEGQSPVDVDALAQAGVTALTDDGRGVARDESMREVFKANARARLPLLQHAEVPGHGAALAEGPTQKKLGLKPYPADAEWRMVERDLSLLAEFPEQRYHVLHVSSAKTVELISEARRRGLKVSGEVSPHHLFYTSEDIPFDDASYKMNPPLRSHADQAVLREAIADGRLSFVATDHAPHESAMKGHDYASSAFGTTGLEALFRVILKLYTDKLISSERVVQVFSSEPARFLGIDQEFGRVEAGRELRAILMDPRAPERPLVLEELESQAKNSCFLGAKLPGRIHWHFTSIGAFRF